VTTATERGQAIEDETVAKWRPLLRRQFELALAMKARQARDAASGVSSVIARREAIDAGLDRRIADAVEDMR
jgi:carbamoylphosphate synthase large subunit